MTSERTGAADRPALLADRGLLLLAAAVVVVSAPVVLRGAPLADDFHTCMQPVQDGSFAPFLRGSWQELGLVRPARFLEIALIGGLCQRVPFGVVIAVPLLLTLLVAVLLRGLLHDLRLRPPWPEVGAGVWLLQPLGTEAALWPSALHVPLGLALALAAIRLHRRGRHVLGTSAALGACLSVEQVVFALPLVMWLLAGRHRRRAAILTSALVGVVLVAYALVPGDDPRTDVPISERLTSLVENPEWYLVFPAVGTGFHSGALAVAWSFPLGLVLLVAAGLLGGRASRLWRPARALRLRGGLRQALLLGAVLVLVNLPLASTTPRGYSARTFTPTWLVLAGTAALVAAAVHWRPGRAVTAGCAVLAAVALLSQALSVSVRVRTADFTEASSRWMAAQVEDGATVEVCDVPRTAVTPAPLGAFHLHELHWRWASAEAVEYYTGREITVSRSGRYWEGACGDHPGADLSIPFPRLQEVIP